MSVNINAVGKDSAISVTDRRIRLQGQLASDSAKFNKIMNYLSNRYHGTVTFVESPSEETSNNLKEKQSPFIALATKDKFHEKIGLERGIDGRWKKVDGIYRPRVESLDDFMVFLGSAFKETVPEYTGYNIESLPHFCYQFYDRITSRFVRGVMQYETNKSQVILDTIEIPHFSTGEGGPIATEYLNTLGSLTDMECAELVFSVSNAYMASRSGPVGGTFKATLNTPDGLKLLGRSMRCAMNILSGAYVAGQIVGKSGSGAAVAEKLNNGELGPETVAKAYLAGFVSVRDDIEERVRHAVPTREALIDVYDGLLTKEGQEILPIYTMAAKLTNQTIEGVTQSTPGLNYWMELQGEHKE